MKKYFFGVQRWTDQVVPGTERTKRVPVMVYGKHGFDTKFEAIAANQEFIEKQSSGTKFCVVAFDVTEEGLQ